VVKNLAAVGDESLTQIVYALKIKQDNIKRPDLQEEFAIFNVRRLVEHVIHMPNENIY
jgi:hypothetical protein